MTITEQQEAADQLVQLIMRTFFFSYFSRMNGMTLDELLISHDIEAAGCGADTKLQQTARLAIRSAVNAVDKGVPYPIAHNCLLDQIGSCMVAHIKHKRHVSHQFVIQSINHALGQD
jgi:hypothetical protein